MSEVLKSDRQESSSNYIYESIKLRKDLTQLLLRDFGVKDKIRTLKNPLSKISRFDNFILNRIFKKYNCKSILYTYPEWMITFFRENILRHCQELIDNLTIAYNINPYLKEENVLKRLYYDKALCSNKELLQDMQYIIEILPVDANKYMPYVSKIKRINDLIKNARSKNNKKMNKLKNESNLTEKHLEEIIG